MVARKYTVFTQHSGSALKRIYQNSNLEQALEVKLLENTYLNKHDEK